MLKSHLIVLALSSAASALVLPLAAEAASPSGRSAVTATDPANPAPAAARPLTFERVFASPALNGPAPRGVRISPDGRFVTMLRNREDDRQRYDLWAYERATGKWRMLVDSLKLGSGRALSEAEKMQRERARVGTLKGIVNYDWTEDGSAIVVPLDGDLFLAHLDGKVERLTDSPEDELNAALSPRGRYLSFVQDQRLYVGAPRPGASVAITPAESSKTVHWGEAEFVAQEEMARTKGFWWSPNEDRLAVERFDEAPVGIVTRTAIGTDGAKSYQQRYPAAGTPNALVSLHLMNPDGADRVTVDLGPDKDIYLARVDWARDGRTLYVQRENRAQTELDMLAVDPATGRCRVLFSEKAPAKDWINLSSNYRFLKDGSLIWWSERDGFGHLYHYDDGKWQQLTRGPWVVTDLVGVDEASGRLLFTGTMDDVLAPQVYAIDYRHPGTPQRLTDADFVNTATASKDGKLMVVSRSSVHQPLQSYVADEAGKRLAWVEENRLDAAHPYAPYLAGYHVPRFGTIRAADGSELHWKMLMPQMEAGKRYPVFFQHYGGPGSQEVNRGWAGGLAQAIVDQGFIWFEIDNRGSDNRGAAFEKQIWRAMGSVEVEDQRAGAAYLETLPYVDPKKIAIYGWSYGGYMTLKMLEADQGLYAAGIAGAPVTKWELYDTHYTERYMGDPTKVPEAYARADAIGNATKIADPLLIIHGMSDDNVVLDNSTAMFAALQENDRPFEMMLYPGQTHAAGGPKISPHIWHTIFNFLARHGVTPPQ